jgi:hypothetical protein
MQGKRMRRNLPASSWNQQEEEEERREDNKENGREEISSKVPSKVQVCCCEKQEEKKLGKNVKPKEEQNLGKTVEVKTIGKETVEEGEREEEIIELNKVEIEKTVGEIEEELLGIEKNLSSIAMEKNEGNEDATAVNENIEGKRRRRNIRKRMSKRRCKEAREKEKEEEVRAFEEAISSAQTVAEERKEKKNPFKEKMINKQAEKRKTDINKGEEINNLNFRVNNCFKKDVLEDIMEGETEDRQEKKKTKDCSTAEIIGMIGGYHEKILVDTGSEVSLMSKEKLMEIEEKNSIKIDQTPVGEVTVMGVTGVRSKRITKQAIIPLKFGNVEVNVCFLVVERVNIEIIIGMDKLREWQAEVNIKKGWVSLHFEKESVEIELSKERTKTTYSFFQCQFEEEEEWMKKLDRIKEIIKDEKEASKLIRIYEKQREVFSDTPGCAKNFVHKLQIREGASFDRKSYPVPYTMKRAVEEEIRRMIDADIIEESSSEFTSPIVVVPKTDGSVRLCLDARQINKLIIGDKTSTEGIDEIIKKFHGTKFISKFDLTAGYWQVPLHEESRKYVAFLYGGRNYQFKRLAFGLVNSVAVFIKCINQILGEQILEYTTAYVDDLLITSDNFEEHCERVNKVLERLKEGNITVNLKKSEFLTKETKFLGYIISEKGISVDPEKVIAIRKHPTPKSVKQLQSFLGMCNFYRKFQHKYSNLTGQLTHLVSGKLTWKWGEKEEKVFQNIKDKFISCVMLHHPNFDETFVMNTDASDISVGVELYQRGTDEEHQVISFASRCLTKCERNYTITEKELLSVVFGCRKFRTFILGRKLLVRTDHKALTYLKTCHVVNRRMLRWMLELQEYDIEWEYLPGKENIVADLLSRTDIENQEIREEEKFFKVLNLNEKFPEDIIAELKEKQKEDRHLKKVMEQMEQGDHQENTTYYLDFYIIHKGILFKRKNEDWKICTPESMEEKIIKWYHEKAHMGSKKTQKILQEHWDIKGMSKKVFKTVTACEMCQKIKHTNFKKEGEMVSIIPERKLHKVFVDLCGPFPKSRGNFQFIFIMIDGFTKYTKLYPIRRANTGNVLKKIHEYINEIGKPETIISDHGSQFRGRKWTEELERQGIKSYKSAVYHPQSNLSERPLREVGRMLRLHCHANHVKWIEYVNYIEKEINHNYHESTNETPYYAQWGKRPARAVEELVEFPNNDKTPEKMEDIQERIKHYLIWKAANRKERHDREVRKKIQYAEGDKVLVRNHQLSCAENKIMKKLMLIYVGPYRISRIKNKNGYELKNEDGIIIGTYNVRDLRKFRE